MTSLKRILFTGVSGLGLLLAACNSTDGGGRAVSAEEMVGIWTAVSMHEKGTETTTAPGQSPVTETKDTLTTFPPGSTMEFKSDGSYSMNAGLALTGTWSVSGNTVTTITTIPLLNMKDTSAWEVSLNGKEGVFVETDKSTTEFLGVKVESDMVTTLRATKQ